MGKPTEKNVLFGISFDAVPMSGLIVEFMKVADIFHKIGYEIYLDLGYDIKVDKNNFYKRYDESSGWVPSWIKLQRMCDLTDIKDYSKDYVEYVLKNIVCDRGNASFSPKEWQRINTLINEIRNRILRVWKKLNVSFIIVENGTLPENIIFTNALYQAIEVYGEEKDLGKFVMWRDHDLMWWSEPGKYGEYPYCGTPKLRYSPHIQYVVLHEPAKEKLFEWSHDANVEVLANTFSFDPAGINEQNKFFRRDFGIPEDALLIGHCTRIIRQKRIDRDIHLLSELNQMAQRQDIHKDIYLFIAGNIGEDQNEYQNLRNYASELGVASRVIFGNELRSYGNIHETCLCVSKYSIQDLLAHSNINSFLTSYNYEGFGNPIGESIASQTPYITTSYELYKNIYGNLGFKGLVLPITKEDDDLAKEDFVRAVFSLLMDTRKCRQYVIHNYNLGRKHFSPENLEHKIHKMFIE
jgi:glycosyltransferase involved in cell wall biosynthesis